MKKFKLVACAAAAAAMFATNAFAAADMDSSADSSGGGTYVGESTIDATNGTLLNTGAAALQEALVTLGASFATDSVAYVRFDLPAGVTYTGAPTFAITGSTNAATVSVAQGGAGQNYVIFAVAPAGGENLVGANQGTFAGAAAGGITVKNRDAVSLTYKLFETLTNAANSTLPLKTASEATFISFANAVSFGTTTAQSAVADVSAAGGAYTAFTGAAAEKAVATLNVTHTARALVASGVATTIVDDVLVDTNSIVVSGDFTAAVANGVDLRVANCAGANAAGVTSTIAADKLSVTFSAITAAVIEQVLAVCYETNGTTPIVASTYSGTVDLVADTGFTVADGVTGTGEITRNGTVLKAAFGETPVGSFSGTVNLTNTGSNAAPFTTSCLTTTGRVAGNAGSVAANSASRFGIGSAAGLNCPTNTRGVELTFAVPTGNVIGSVVRQDASTGQAAFDGMVGNQ